MCGETGAAVISRVMSWRRFDLILYEENGIGHRHVRVIYLDGMLPHRSVGEYPTSSLPPGKGRAILIDAGILGFATHEMCGAECCHAAR